jgi:hypothetical protein
MSKFKIGDRVKISKSSEYYDEGDNSSSNPNVEGTICEDNRGGSEFKIGVDWDNNTYNHYPESDLELVNCKQTNMNQIMKDAVLDTANSLLKAQNTVTTLEIKAELIVKQPQFFWTQAFVSASMDDFQNQGLFNYTDNGTYRIYVDPNSTIIQQGVCGSQGQTGTTPASSLVAQPATQTAPSPTKTRTRKPDNRISKTKALDLLKNSKGHFFTAVFLKKDGSERTINGQYLKDQDNSPLGFVKVKESSKLKQAKNTPSGVRKDVIRQINVQTLRSLKIGGQLYKVRA